MTRGWMCVTAESRGAAGSGQPPICSQPRSVRRQRPALRVGGRGAGAVWAEPAEAASLPPPGRAASPAGGGPVSQKQGRRKRISQGTGVFRRVESEAAARPPVPVSACKACAAGWPGCTARPLIPFANGNLSNPRGDHRAPSRVACGQPLPRPRVAAAQRGVANDPQVPLVGVAPAEVRRLPPSGPPGLPRLDPCPTFLTDTQERNMGASTMGLGCANLVRGPTARRDGACQSRLASPIDRVYERATRHHSQALLRRN